MLQVKTPVELGRFMACMSVAEELMVPSYQAGKPESMLALAEIYGIDPKALRGDTKNRSRKQSSHVQKEKTGEELKSSARKGPKRKGK